MNIADKVEKLIFTKPKFSYSYKSVYLFYYVFIYTAYFFIGHFYKTLRLHFEKKRFGEYPVIIQGRNTNIQWPQFSLITFKIIPMLLCYLTLCDNV